jgi:dolichyl-phosphate beta-glucosyltransferase
MDLSVVLPSYRSAALAGRSADELHDTFALLRPGSWEVIVVDDGGGDFPEGWRADDPSVRLIRLDRNRGKGAAVIAGMRAATGKARVYVDVDLPYDPELILVISRYLTTGGFHVVAGDRTLPSAAYHMEIGFSRRIISRVSAAVIGTFVTGGFFDTQCGIKGIRGDVADHLFQLLRISRFAFDVELIYLSLSHRLDIKRIPVRLRRNETSTVRPVRDSLRAFVDLARIKLNQMRGRYACPALEQLVVHEFAQARERARRISGPPAEAPGSQAEPVALV